eukprot:11335356-Karenia_brevis.AAC.1
MQQYRIAMPCQWMGVPSLIAKLNRGLRSYNMQAVALNKLRSMDYVSNPEATKRTRLAPNLE